ncbi:hypothetical protein HYV85_02545 [Candidatus Woesearchaeota archaeon]|nr:hypothetical protein [Candidatus Woesearchaeota archaeon]
MVKTGTILRFLFVVFMIWVIFELVGKIFGGSLGFQELMIVMLSINIGFSFKLNSMVSKVDSKLSGHIGWHRGRESHIK